MKQATWDIQIADDGIMENGEKFQIFLEEPINAVLGRKVKMNIHIINAENGKEWTIEHAQNSLIALVINQRDIYIRLLFCSGECPQYLGMISKNNKEVIDLEDSSVPSPNKKAETIGTVSKRSLNYTYISR